MQHGTLTPSGGMDPVPPVVDPTSRVPYAGEPLSDDAVVTLRASGPLAVLQRWYAEAGADHRVAEPAAMVLATVDGQGRPNARTVLLKGLDARGLAFYTNRESAKARELAGVPWAAVVLTWHPMFRQVRARGPVVPVDDAEADAYFATRPRESQVGAWASRQSAPVGSRHELDAAVARQRDRWAGHEEVPRPPFWGGYRVQPVDVELWVGHASRLHDRVAFRTRDGEPAPLDDPAAWELVRLQP